MKVLSQAFNRKNIGWSQIPRPLQIFLLRGICTLIAWKALYLFVFLPLHQPDHALSYATASTTTWVFNLVSPAMQPILYPDQDMVITAIVQGNRINTIMIADACNALELMVLFAGFVLCVPAPLRKQLKYVSIGILIIFAANVLRCLALNFVYISFPNFFAFAHHYLFTVTIYFIIFLLWKRFMKEWITYAKK